MPCSAKYRRVLSDSIYRGTAAVATILWLASSPCVPASAQSSAATTSQYGTVKTQAEQLYDALHNARAQVRANPNDPQAHFQLGELLRKTGRNREAAQEYLEATGLNPTMYVAFHELSVTTEDPQLLDEGIARLEKAKEARPKELMLRVALSEMLEKRHFYAQAARTLIDLQYDNGVPQKYSPRINARIHYLLAKSKEAQLAEKQASPADDELDVVPAPLPDAGLRKPLTASKIKESKEMKGMGHVPLLP